MTAPVFRDWSLPACFADFRARLERQNGLGAIEAAKRPVPAPPSETFTSTDQGKRHAVRDIGAKFLHEIERKAGLARTIGVKKPDAGIEADAFAG